MAYETMAFYKAFVLYFLVIQRIIKLLTVSAVSNSTKYTRLHNRIQKNFRGIAFYEHLSTHFYSSKIYFNCSFFR